MSISQLLSSDNNDRRAVYSPTEMPVPMPSSNYPPIANIAPAHIASASHRPHVAPSAPQPPSNLPHANLHGSKLSPVNIAQPTIANVAPAQPPQYSSFDPIERRNNGIQNLLNNDNDDRYQMADSDTDTEDIPLIRSPKTTSTKKDASKANNGKSAAAKVHVTFSCLVSFSLTLILLFSVSLEENR